MPETNQEKNTKLHTGMKKRKDTFKKKKFQQVMCIARGEGGRLSQAHKHTALGKKSAVKKHI